MLATAPSIQLDQHDGYDDKTDLGKKMNRFEDFLRCPCCGEFFDNPMSLNCGHVYCSECIRKHLDSVINTMHTSSRCPSCPQQAEASHLKPARAISQLLESYLHVRDDLIVNVEGGVTLQNKNDENVNEDFVPPLHKYEGKGTKVQARTSSSLPSSKISHMTHKVFHGLSLAKAKQMVQELSSKSQVKIKLDGDKDALARRYRDFVNLNNSQLYKENPMSIEKMCSEINKREIAREKETLKLKHHKGGKKIEALKNGVSNDGFLELARQIKRQKKINDENKKSRRLPGEMEHSSWEGYRIVFSKKALRPFYYHIETGVGSWEMPVALAMLPPIPPSVSSPSNVQSQDTHSSSQNDTTNENFSDVKKTPENTSSQKVTRSSTRKRKKNPSQSHEVQASQELPQDGDIRIQEAALSLSASSDVVDTVDNSDRGKDNDHWDNSVDITTVNEGTETIQPVVNSTSAQFSVESGNLAWNCNICTFLNDSSFRVCEMCGNDGPPRKSSRRFSQGAAAGATQTSQVSPPKKNAFDNMVFASASGASQGNKNSRAGSAVGSQGGRKSGTGRRSH